MRWWRRQSFRAWLSQRDGKWVTIWTLDGASDSDGCPLSIVGRLSVHRDFLEIKSEHGVLHAVRFAAISTVNDRMDADELMLKLQENESARDKMEV